MDDLDGKDISFTDDKELPRVGTINWKRDGNRVSIRYGSEGHPRSTGTEEFLTDENTLREKIGQGIWFLID